MIKFEDRFVHFRWSDNLAGKQVIYGDSIKELEESLNSALNKSGIVSKNTDPATEYSYPFEVDNTDPWKFVYCDPNFACKRAYENGETIQCLTVSGEWKDCEPCWSDATQYRIKPESSKRATYKELSEWLAKGKGQYRTCITATIMFTFMDYTFDADNKEVPEDYLVRPWGSDKWFIPTKEVLNG